MTNEAVRPQTPEGPAEEPADSLRAGLLQVGPLAVAGVVSNGASLVVTVVMARLLSQHDYGSLNQLLGLFLIVSMPGSAVAVAVVRRVTGWPSPDVVRRWAARVHAQGTVATVVFSLAVVAAGGAIASALGQHDAVGSVCILSAGAVWILLQLDRGLLQANRRYRALAANFLVEGGARVGAMMGLVAAGFGVPGAAAGMLLAEIATSVHARIAADRAWSLHASTGSLSRFRSLLRSAPDLRSARDQRRHLLVDLSTAFVALAMVALLQNIDVIVVGRENSSLSGSYAAISVTCKALVFAAIVLGGYLLPEATIRWRDGGHALRQLGVTLVVLAVPAGALALASLVFPRFFLSLAFPAKDLHAVSAFVPLVLAMICLAVTVVLTMYLLAVGCRWVAPLLVAGGAAATAAVVAAGGHPATTAWYDLATQVFLVAVVAVGFVRLHRPRLRVGGKMAGGGT